MKHTDTISHFENDFDSLTEEIGNLKYDALALFLEKLSEKILIDGKKDESRDRTKLSSELFESSTQIKNAAKSIEKAWVICKPYMKY